MMALVRALTAEETEAGESVKVSGSMSANTGVAPVMATALAVAANVKEGTITSSPGPIPAASSPRCRAEVPELRAIARVPGTIWRANSSSNASTWGPCAIIPVRMTRATALISSSPMRGRAGGMKGRVTASPCPARPPGRSAPWPPHPGG